MLVALLEISDVEKEVNLEGALMHKRDKCGKLDGVSCRYGV